MDHTWYHTRYHTRYHTLKNTTDDFSPVSAALACSTAAFSAAAFSAAMVSAAAFSALAVSTCRVRPADARAAAPRRPAAARARAERARRAEAPPRDARSSTARRCLLHPLLTKRVLFSARQPARRQMLACAERARRPVEAAKQLVCGRHARTVGSAAQDSGHLARSTSPERKVRCGQCRPAERSS